MAGFGSQPYGSSPYGIGTPAVAEPLGGKLLRDEFTSEQHGSRRVDSVTKDYVLDDNGRILGMRNVNHLVQMAVSTDRGSSAMRQLGHELRSIERISANFVRRVDSALRDAVQHIVNRGLIEVLDVQVEIVRPGVAFARLRWRDLNTGNIEETLTDT